MVGAVRNDDAARFTEQMAVAAKQQAAAATETRVESQDAAIASLFSEEQEGTGVNLLAQAKKLQPPPKSAAVEKKEQVGQSVLVRKENAEMAFDKFKKKDNNENWNLDRDVLSDLAVDLVKENVITQSQSEIVQKIVAKMTTPQGKAPDPGQVDKAFEFLVEIAQEEFNKAKAGNFSNTEMYEEIFNKLAFAKATYDADHKEEIATSRQFLGLAVQLRTGEKSLETPEALQQIRDLINNPQELMSLVNVYKSKGYTYKEIHAETKSILKFIGIELKRSVGEIQGEERTKIILLLQSARKGQAIIQVFRQIKKAFTQAIGHIQRMGMEIFE